jgi:hypothetical protein
MAQHLNLKVRIGFVIVITGFVLGACSSAVSTPTAAIPTPGLPSPEPTSTIAITSEMQPAQTQPAESPLVMSYRSILLIERAADLMIEYLGEVQSGSIDGHDPAVRQPFTLAFPIAIQTYNKTTPPPGLGQMWMNVTSIAVEYNKVYELIQQGKPVALADYYNLKAFRQILASSQVSVEVSLGNNGLGQDYFSAEKLAVDQILQQEYGDIPVPTVSP